MGQSTWDHNIYFYCNLVFINKYSNNIIPSHFIRDSNNCDIGNNWSIHIKPYILMIFLLFLGGVIVLIIYMSTLSANEKFSPMVVTFPLFVLLALIMSITSNSLTQSFSNRVTSRSFMSQLYQHKNARLLLFLIVYLLITLVCVVKLVKYEEGPLSKRL